MSQANGKLRIAVSGYYGCGNTGDEAVLAGIAESFTRRQGAESTEFVVLSADPADTERRHGFRVVERMKRTALLRTFRECDLLLSGGGSLLQDTTSLRSLLYYLWVVRLAQRAGLPVMFYAQGLGPLHRGLSRRLVRLVANRVQAITVRDRASADLLKEIGVHRPRVTVTADPAFALQPCESRVQARKTLAAQGIPIDRPLVGIALRPWHDEGPTVDDFRQMTLEIAEKTGAHPLFLPMQPPGDTELSRRIAESVQSEIPGGASVLQETRTPHEMLNAVNTLDGLCAMRLHTLIFGAICRIPMVSLSYDPKVTVLMERLGLAEYNRPLADFEADRIALDMAKAMSNSTAIRQTLESGIEGLTKAALENVDIALSCVGATALQRT